VEEGVSADQQRGRDGFARGTERGDGAGDLPPGLRLGNRQNYPRRQAAELSGNDRVRQALSGFKGRTSARLSRIESLTLRAIFTFSGVLQ